MSLMAKVLGLYWLIFVWPVETLIAKKLPWLFAIYVLTVGFPCTAYAVYLWVRAWRDG